MNLAELTKMYDFTGRTVVVTGGTGVLGQAMVRAIVGCGANVALVARNREKAEPQVAALEGPGRAVVFEADVLDAAGLKAAAEEVGKEFGQIDGLLNGAGGNHPSATTKPDLSFFDLPEDALRFVFDLNMMGTIIPSQVFGRLMAERGEGVVLNVSSMSAIRPLTRVVGYSAAKAGINSFTQWLAVHLAQEYGPRLRVNAVAPGFFVAEQNRGVLLNADGSYTPRATTIIGRTPMGRFGDPSELVSAVQFLCSDAASFVTGVVIPVDGGFSAFSGV